MKARRKPSHKLAFFFLSLSAFWNICQHQSLQEAEENLVVEEEDGKVFE